MLFKKLFLFFIIVFSCLLGNKLNAQNKAITQILVQKQDSSWGTNVAQALLSHLYLQLRLGKITGYTDLTCKQRIESTDLQQIERYYQHRLDSADGIFLYEQWDFEKDSIRIYQGGLSIILKNEEKKVQKKNSSSTEIRFTELIYFPYSSLKNDLQLAMIPANMNGNCEVYFDDWLQKRGFSGEIIFFAGRFFSEEKGHQFEEKIKSKFHLTENNEMGISRKMEHFLYANHAQYDPIGTEIANLFENYFSENPEQYFNLFPFTTLDFTQFRFPKLEQIVVRRRISKKNKNLFSEPVDVIMLYKDGIKPDTIKFSELQNLHIPYQNLGLYTYLATSAKERLIQVNSTPIPLPLASRMFDLIENEKNLDLWNRLSQKLKEYEGFLD